MAESKEELKSFLMKVKEESEKDGLQKDLSDPDNHDGVHTHLEPDILECEVKWVKTSWEICMQVKKQQL